MAKSLHTTSLSRRTVLKTGTGIVVAASAGAAVVSASALPSTETTIMRLERQRQAVATEEKALGDHMLALHRSMEADGLISPSKLMDLHSPAFPKAMEEHGRKCNADPRHQEILRLEKTVSADLTNRLNDLELAIMRTPLEGPQDFDIKMQSFLRHTDGCELEDEDREFLAGLPADVKRFVEGAKS